MVYKAIKELWKMYGWYCSHAGHADVIMFSQTIKCMTQHEAEFQQYLTNKKSGSKERLYWERVKLLYDFLNAYSS